MISLMRRVDSRVTPVQTYLTDHTVKRRIRHGQLAGKTREAGPHEGMLETSQEAMSDPQCEGNWGQEVAGHPQHGESHG